MQKEVTVTKERKQINGKTKTIKETLLKYNFNVIQDSTLMMQYFSSNIIIPIMMFGTLMTNSFNLSRLAVENWWGVIFFIGFLYSFMTLNRISIAGVIISLDRNNFLFIKSLPFSLEFYLKNKFQFVYLVQLALPFLITTGLMLWIKLPLILMLLFLLGLLVGIFLLSERYFIQDYRDLNLDWQNITELFTRGGGNFIQSIRIFAMLFAGILIIVGTVFLMSSLTSFGRMLLSTALVLVPLALTILSATRNKKNFWMTLD